MVGVHCREITLNSVGVLAAIFAFGAAPRPTKTLGVKDYGGGVKSLGLCPSTPNCLATSEVANDPFHYAPPMYGSSARVFTLNIWLYLCTTPDLISCY